MKNLGIYIKSRRKNIGLTQVELAEKVGLTPLTIRRYESGEREPSFSVFVKLCEVLGMRIEDFIHERSGENDLL